MAKNRSPEYPAIGLNEAIEKVRMVWTNDYQNKVPKQVIAEHMGYKGLNGGSLPVISALSKYGLLEGRGDETRVSDIALAILVHEPGTPERAAALKQAAEAPELFAELDNKFQGGKVSDAAIRSYLLTQKFLPTAADAAIRAYRDTKQLVNAEVPGHTAMAPKQEPPMHAAQQPPPNTSGDTRGRPGGGLPYETTYTPASGAEPFRVSFTGSGIEITGKLTTPDVADEFIRAVSALKMLLRPVGSVERPRTDASHASEPSQQQVSADKPHEPAASVSFMITNAQKDALRQLGYTDRGIADMTPAYAHDLLRRSGVTTAN